MKARKPRELPGVARERRAVVDFLLAPTLDPALFNKRAFMGPRAPAATPANAQTVAVLESLLISAKAGRLLGLAYVGIEEAGYTYSIAGEALEAPVFTRGALRTLEDKLAEIIAARRGADRG